MVKLWKAFSRLLSLIRNHFGRVSNVQKNVDAWPYTAFYFGPRKLKFQRDMTHLIVHLVKINEARFLFDDIFSIMCTFLRVGRGSKWGIICNTLVTSLCSSSKGKSQATSSCATSIHLTSWHAVSFLMNCSLQEDTKNHFHLKLFSFEGEGKFQRNEMSREEINEETVDKLGKFCRMPGTWETRPDPRVSDILLSASSPTSISSLQWQIGSKGHRETHKEPYHKRRNTRLFFFYCNIFYVLLLK